MNAREAAYNALLRHENNASYSNIELDATIKKYGLDGVERSFCTALFYGVIERAITLDYYISLLSDRTDIDTKKKAEQLFADFGLSMTSAINVFLKQVIREKRIPFEIGYETPNSLTAKVMKETEEGKNLSPAFDSIAELMDSLHA